MPPPSVHQRGLVDTCFEEGQYQPGIAVLDQLRSPSVSPPPDLVRQLLYIALFPPEHSPPSKASLSPSVADAVAARRVLFSFLSTNTPSALARALPSGAVSPSAPSDSQDALVAQESLCISDCRNCWLILQDGFIHRGDLLPRDARKKRQKTLDDAVLGQRVPVAEHAWPVLEWLLSLFEKDESQETFSPLLLSQIPPTTSGPRWEAGAPLDIVFHAIDQADGERRDLATRLLTLLINLTLSGSFDGPMFAASLTSRLHSAPPQVVQNLFESLPKTIPVLAFKITVCQRFLSPTVTGQTKPRPKPLPRRGALRDAMATSSTDVGRTAPSRPTSVSCSQVFQSLEHVPPALASGPPVHTVVKYVLLTSYAHLQALLPPDERDEGWKDALSSGRLKQVIDDTFPSDGTHHKALALFASLWQAGR